MDSEKQEGIMEMVPMIHYLFEKVFCRYSRINYIRMDVSLNRIDGYKSQMEFLVGLSMLQCVETFLQFLCVRLRNGIVRLGILHFADVDDIVGTIYQQIYLHAVSIIVTTDNKR